MKFKLSKESVKQLRGIVSNEANDFVQEQAEEVISFESNPMEYILNKYPSLTDTLSDLLTDYFRDYVTGVFVVAPKPTTFKVLLHNGQMFFLIYGPKSWIAKVAGKRYYLLNLNEEESAIEAIARLLELGRPPGSQGPDEATGTEKAKEEGGEEEAPAEEAPAEEEGSGEEAGMTESVKQKKIKLVLRETKTLDELTISPDYASKKGPNPYYTLQSDADKQIKSSLKTSDNLVYKNIEALPKGKKLSYSEPKGSFVFRVMTINDEGKITPTEKYISLSKKSIKGHYGEKSSGSGGGAKQTALQESAQCLANAVRYSMDEDITPEKLLVAINPKNVKKYVSRIETNIPTDQLIAFLNENPDWQNTSCKTANLLAGGYPANFKFYRQAGIVPKIEIAAKTALKKANIDANINKWNPADIWMATEEANSINFPTELNELNALIKQLYTDKVLVGVSLKKCTGCNIEVYNVDKKSKPAQKFDKIRPKDKDIFKTKDIYIESNASEIQFRNFSNITGWQGQVTGGEAAGGKIGAGEINRTLIGLKKEALPQEISIEEDARKLTPEFVSDFFKTYRKVKSISPKMNGDEFSKAIKKADLGDRTSNYMNIHLLLRLDNMSDKEKDVFISKIIGYAKSSSDFSSVFAKVS